MAIGTGTETFAWAFYKFRPVGHNLTSEWDFLYNKAHNEYLNFLATTGAFGLGSYLLILGIFTIWFIKQEKKLDVVSIALFSGWISVLVTNFFGFSVVVTQLILFLFPAMVFVSYEKEKTKVFRLNIPSWSSWIPAIAGMVLLFQLSALWYADKRFAHGYQYDRAGLYAQATPDLIAAIAINPGEPIYHDELATNYSALAVSAFSAKNATQAAGLAQLSLAESDRALAISPENVNFLKSRTRVYYTLSSLDPSLNQAAIETLKKTIPLSPNDPKIYYNLAILEGRAGNSNQAVADLLKAKALKPDYRDAYNALNIFYEELGQKDNARAILEEYLKKIDPNDAQFKATLKK